MHCRLLIILVCLVTCLTSCEKVQEANLIGQWELQSLQDENGDDMMWKKPVVWEFTDKNLVYENEKVLGEWSRENNDIVVTIKLYATSGEFMMTQYLKVTKLTAKMLVLEATGFYSSTSSPQPKILTFNKL